MVTETVNLQVDNSQALRGIDQVAKASDKLNATLGRLRNILGGLAIGNFIAGMARSAQQITDLSTVTGIATERILALQLAFQANGASAEDADKALLKLMQSVGEAVDQNKQLQSAFNQVGVSLNDLATLSEEEIFLKVLQGLDGITDRSRKAALSQQLLGKSLRTADYAGVVNDLGKFTQQTRGTAEGIKNFDAASKNIEQGLNNLKNVLFELLSPIAEFVKNINFSVEAIKQLIKVILVIAGVFAVFRYAIRPLELLKDRMAINVVEAKTLSNILLGPLKKAFDVVKNSFWFLAEAFKKGYTVFERFQLFFVGIFKLLARFVGFVGIIYTAFEALKFLNIAFFKSEGIKKFTDSVDDAIASLLEFIGLKEKIDFNQPLLIEGTGAQAAPEGFDNLADYLKRGREERDRNKREVIDAFEKERKAIRQVTEAYKEQNVVTLIGLQRQLQAMGMSQNAAEVEAARNEILDKANEQIRELTQRQQNLTGEELKYWGVIQQQIDAIKTYSEVYAEASANIVTQIQERKLEEQKALLVTERLKQQLESDLAIQQLRDQIELIGLMGDELEDAQIIMEVSQELERKLLLLRQAELDLLAKKKELTQEQFEIELENINKLREAASQYANDRLEVERKVLEKTREAQDDWKAKLKEQLEELADSVSPAQVAVDLFGSVISSVDDALTQFVEKGKFSFKDFAKSLLRDMALIVARAIVMRAILGAVGMIFPGATTGLSALMNATPMRAGGPVSASNPYLVGEAGPELFMPRTAGTIIPNNQLAMAGGGTTQVTYNINAVDASSFRSMVARDPQFIYNVTEVGRRSQPSRRLA